jgi:hypothetical protein
MQATGTVAIRGLSKIVPEWLETSLPLIEFRSQVKLVRRMRHSFGLGVILWAEHKANKEGEAQVNTPPRRILFLVALGL